MKARNQAEIAEKNKNLILKLIILNSPVSRVELAKMTGLTKMTVTNIVSDLILSGLVQENGLISSPGGRKPINLQAVGDKQKIIGIYICRKYVSVFLGNICGEIKKSSKFNLDDNKAKNILSLMTSKIDKYMSKNVVAIGISSIGPVEQATRTILNPPNFYGIENITLGDILENKYHIPVFMDNDMNTSALGEKYFGYGRGIKNFIYLGVTNGVGAGIIANDKLCSGENGYGGEIGHITVDANGKLCPCGNVGCLELYASFPKNWDTMGKKDKSKALEKICKYLAIGCISLINLFDPHTIILGHDICLCDENVCEILQKNIEHKYISRRYKKVDIKLSKFVDKSPIYGTIALCVDKLLG